MSAEKDSFFFHDQRCYYSSLESSSTSKSSSFPSEITQKDNEARHFSFSSGTNEFLVAISCQHEPDWVRWDLLDSPGDLFSHSNDLFTLSHAQQIIWGVNQFLCSPVNEHALACDILADLYLPFQYQWWNYNSALCSWISSTVAAHRTCKSINAVQKN